MKIVLASTSPRRQQLMKDIGFQFEICKPTSDEIERKGESPKKMVARLALEKAENVAAQLRSRGIREPHLIVSADTTVVTPDGKKVLGKPDNFIHAVKMLKQISGKTHRVYTAYTILELNPIKKPKSITQVIETKVSMRKLTSHQIENYVRSGEPMDKAGAYAAQGVGMCLIEEIRGSYTNVVGLPMAELVSDLKKSFKVSPQWDQTPGRKSE